MPSRGTAAKHACDESGLDHSRPATTRGERPAIAAGGEPIRVISIGRRAGAGPCRTSNDPGRARPGPGYPSCRRSSPTDACSDWRKLPGRCRDRQLFSDPAGKRPAGRFPDGRLCDGRGVLPLGPSSWRRASTLSSRAFLSLTLMIAEINPSRVARGTPSRSAARSIHSRHSPGARLARRFASAIARLTFSAEVISAFGKSAARTKLIRPTCWCVFCSNAVLTRHFLKIFIEIPKA